MPFEKVDVNLYGSGGFDKSQLKQVEVSGGLNPKGYIPVMSIDEEVVRESSVLVERGKCAGLDERALAACVANPTVGGSSVSSAVAALSTSVPGATSLIPQDPTRATELVAACNALPKRDQSRELTALMRQCDDACSQTSYLAGETFSVADCCLLPFLQRVEEDIPSDAKHLRAYMQRVRSVPAFAKTVVASWWWWW